MGSQLLGPSAGTIVAIQIAANMPSQVELWEGSPGQGRLISVLEGGPQPKSAGGFTWSGAPLYARAAWISAGQPCEAFIELQSP